MADRRPPITVPIFCTGIPLYFEHASYHTDNNSFLVRYHKQYSLGKRVSAIGGPKKNPYLKASKPIACLLLTSFPLIREQPAAAVCYLTSRETSSAWLRRNSNNTFRSPDGWSMMQKRSGAHNMVHWPRPWPKPILLCGKWSVSVLPTSGKQRLCGTGRPANRSAPQSSGRTGAQLLTAMN